MALLYVDEHNASLDSGIVTDGEVIYEGEFIVDNGGGEVARFDPSSDPLPHGIVVHFNGPDSDALVNDPETYVNYGEIWKYDGDNDDRLYYQPLADVDNIRPLSIDEQTSPSSSEPDFSEGDTVGIVKLGSGETRIVPTGYSYDGTTYSESDSGNFVAIGRVDKKPQKLRIEDAYYERIPTRLDADVFSPSVNT